ncbi:uncharacterized protein AB675_11048 [Cyphellophora attinorum]|uniref:Transcription factor domain-containing protein n=1 Tax=Cyphellophora attinorum TaxID=1664694 RepID=A0A0N0NHB9_9EURO|nr:uncharacterized protein AB675_11048 [Phialophora attinorum]KPI34511.1 hypothetical protein AB675_11048 [Phialophora attinorum]
MSLLTVLGAGRVDPFNANQHNAPTTAAGSLPLYVQHMVDHTINAAVNSWLPSDKQTDLVMARANLMSSLNEEPLAWYSTLMSSMTHHAFASGTQTMPRDREIIRLSYRSKTLELLQEDIRTHGGLPSEEGVLAISTLIVHGGDKDAAEKFTYDDFNAKKAFGKANDMHYYSAIHLDTSHWPSLANFVRLKGGAANVKLSFMGGVFAIVDSSLAWRTLTKPQMTPFIPTAMWMGMTSIKPDSVALLQEKAYLSGLPIVPHTDNYAKLYECLEHTRTVIVRYNQYQRRYTQQNLRPDVKNLYFARILIMHDVLSLPGLEKGDTSGRELLFDLLRYSLLALNQLVLFPLARNNDMPNRLITALSPLLQRAADQSIARPSTDASELFDTSVFLWSWMLTGMLALEHLQTKGSSDWMDELAPYVEHVAIKAEKAAWEMVKGVMERFLWLDSECDNGGRNWWGYACLWLAARSNGRGKVKGVT